MKRAPDPDLQDILTCQGCSNVVVRNGEEICTAVWATRRRSMAPDFEELLCVNCAITEVQEKYDLDFDDARNIIYAAISDSETDAFDGVVAT